jgi:hypothetical protein
VLEIAAKAFVANVFVETTMVNGEVEAFVQPLVDEFQ